MNKTQKTAWFNLIMILFGIAIGIWVTVEVFILGRIPESAYRFWPLMVFFLMIGASIIFIRRKQSPAEVDSDERDDLIKKRAVLASFVSVWILLYATSVIPWLTLGPEGLIPVWLLAVINLGVFFIVMLVYSVAILVQYGWGNKGQKS